MSVRTPDGDNITQGAKADAAVTDSSASASVIALLKGIISKLTTGSVSDTELPAAAALADAAAAAPTTPTVGSVPLLMNATTVDRQRAVVTGLDSTGTGIAAAGVVAQYDDTAPSAVTENQFGAVRMGSDRVLYSQGNIAHDAVDAGLPLKVGGYANSAAPTAVAVGDRVNQWFTLNGRAVVTILSNAQVGDGASCAPGWSETTNTRALASGMMAYNQAADTWDRIRTNHETTALASSARTASTNSSDLTNYNSRGVVLTIDATANTSTAGITVAIKYKCSLSGKYVTLLTSATLFASSATGTVSLVVYPGATVSANLAASAPLPRVWRVEVTHGDASSITYSISANYIN